MNDVFNITNFDVLSDNDNYYFFRALNNGDNSDLDNNITKDEFGNIVKIRTDRERCIGKTKYKETSKLSLEEVVDHIKKNHRIDTNCISLTSNANVALLYGREYYKDKYVIIKVPKNELGSVVVNAGEYMLKEINSRINLLITNNKLSDNTKFYLEEIEKINSKDQLNQIIIHHEIKEQLDFDIVSEKYNEHISTNLTTVDYQALNKEQNIEKDKINAKVSIIEKNILNNISNKNLIETINNAFSSLEFIHYNTITQDKLIEVPKEIIDIFAILQQVPNKIPKISELKQELLNKVINKNIKVEQFVYDNYYLDINNYHLIEKIYNLTNGKLDFNSTINLYKKSFYLAKSKLRTISMIILLNKQFENNKKYKDILEYLKINTYGVEPTIFSKNNTNNFKVSELVSLDLSLNERDLFNFINELDTTNLNFIINKPLEFLEYYLSSKNIKNINLSKKEYYANAIIDILELSNKNDLNISPNQRKTLVKKLLNNNILDLYDKLKEDKSLEDKILKILQG